MLLLRRAFFYALYGAFIVLPLVLLVGRGVFVAQSGWDFALMLFVSPILAIVMLIVMGLTLARKQVRRERAVSLLDLGVHAAWYLSIVAAALFAHPVALSAAIILSVAAFWAALWQWISETRRRVKSAFADLEQTVIPASEYYSQRPSPDAPGAGTVIRIEPPREPGEQ